MSDPGSVTLADDRDRSLRTVGNISYLLHTVVAIGAVVYAGEGCAQVLFFESDEVCETSYKDRGGKYQGQTGVTLPKA